MHVNDINFGRDVNPFSRDSLIMKGILTEKRLDPFNTALSMRELYDTEYGIYDHSHPAASPTAVFEMHACEDPYTGGEQERLEGEILSKRLPEILNMPIDDILSFPRWRLDFYLKWASKPTSDQQELQRLERESMERATQILKKP